MSLLDGRYRVERELARGGMGRVFRAVDERLRRAVAVKTLHEGASQALQLRFVEEAQITGQLRHPNVIPVHELSRAGDELFLAMQLIQGRELKDLVRELAADTDGKVRRAYPLGRRLRLFLQICEAMAFAHDRGVIHRDLKPQNVMLGEGDVVLVMDWGVAKPVRGPEESRLEQSVDSFLRSGSDDLDDEDDESGQLTQRGAVIGTPAYMPPEQAEGVPDLDTRADVYALGGILYELLTFEPPFSGRAGKVLRLLFKGPPPTPRERAPELEIPAAVEAIALRAMARDRAERYPSAAALADDVRAYLDDRAIGAYAEDLGETLRRLWRRHKGALRTAGAAALLIAAVWGGALYAAGAAAGEARRQQALAEDARVEAEALAEEARVSMRAQRSSAQASELLRGAYETQVAFQRLAAEVREVDAVLAGSDAARAELEAAGQALAPLLAEGAADTFRAGLEDARRRVQRRTVDVLLARAPSRLQARSASLEATPVDLARALLRQGRPRAAAELLRGAPASAARDALALVASDEGPEATIPALERVMAADPEAAWPYLRRAVARVAAGRLEEAEQDFLRAQVMDPLDGWVLFERLRWVTPPYTNHVLVRNPLQVVGGVTRNDADGDAVRVGGLARELVPRMSAVTELRRVATKFRASWLPNGENAGLARTWEGQLERGELPPDEGWAYLAEGALAYGEPERALGYASRGLEQVPGERQLAGFRAEALLRLERLDEARVAAEEGLAAHAWDPRLNYVRGEVLLRRGQPFDAVDNLRIGVRGWLLSDRWERLAACLAEFQEPRAWKEGVEAARQALARDPFLENHLHPDWRPIGEDPQPHRTLAKLRIKQGLPILGALHLTRARVLSGLPSVQERLGPSRRDDAALAELHEELGLLPAAAIYWQEAARDPALREQAEARLKAIEERLR